MDPAALLPLALLLALSGLFSGAETALFALPPEEVRRLAEKRSPAGVAIARLRRAPRALLVTLLCGNLAVNVLYFATSARWIGALAGREGAAAAAAAGAASFAAILLLGEIGPKALAVHAPARAARLAVFPVAAASVLLAPVRRPLDALVRTLTTLLAGPRRPTALDTEELSALADLAAEGGALAPPESRMLREVLAAEDLRAREIMVPRARLPVLPWDVPREELLSAARGSPEAFVLLERAGTPGFVEGIVRVRDVVLAPGRAPRELAAVPTLVPAALTVEGLLYALRAAGGAERAVVVDERGRALGLVALEDAVVALVGESAGGGP
ncbi:MAG: CNNM domain-containing protein [Planctomycetales bacterium]|nr:CNNM domain-containing protein [Planctomycetales bacterium]